jgi:integral membrane protein
MLNCFRAISILEGFSYLTILCVTVGLLNRDYVFHLGMIHGALFMLYLLLSLIVANIHRWSLKIFLPIFLASLIPFAFIPVEIFLSKAKNKKALR